MNRATCVPTSHEAGGTVQGLTPKFISFHLRNKIGHPRCLGNKNAKPRVVLGIWKDCPHLFHHFQHHHNQVCQHGFQKRRKKRFDHRPLYDDTAYLDAAPTSISLPKPPAMAPKRRAPPPPPVESSEEPNTGSAATGDESDEEEIASSPAPKNKAPRPPKFQFQQVESSDEDEEEEKEEEQGGDEVDEEEEVSESDKEEEAVPPPQLKSALKKKPEGPGPRKGNKNQRAWSKAYEVLILEAHVAHRHLHGNLPKPNELQAALAGKLSRGYSLAELTAKRKSLQCLYGRTKRNPPSDGTDRQIFDLCKEIWGGGDKPKPPAAKVPSDFGELCEKYPFLGEELIKVEKAHPALFKRKFSPIDADVASKMDEKIKKQRLKHMNLWLRHDALIKQVHMELSQIN